MFYKDKKFKILLADDDYLNHVFYREILPEDNFEIIYVINGKDAVMKTRLFSDFDLIMMDLKMPHIDGHRAIRKIRSYNKEIPILIQSAYISDNDVKLLSGVPNLYYIDKPVREDELLEKLEEILSSGE